MLMSQLLSKTLLPSPGWRVNDIDTITVTHCTSYFAAAQIYGELRTRVSKGESGMRYTF